MILPPGLHTRSSSRRAVYGNHRVKARGGIAKLQNVCLFKDDVAAIGVFLLRALEHIGRKVRCNQTFAFACDYAAEQPRAAGAFQHIVARANRRLHRGAQGAVGLAIDAVGKNIVYPRYMIPEHVLLLWVYFSLILRQKSQQSPPRPSVLVRSQATSGKSRLCGSSGYPARRQY